MSISVAPTSPGIPSHSPPPAQNTPDTSRQEAWEPDEASIRANKKEQHRTDNANAEFHQPNLRRNHLVESYAKSNNKPMRTPGNFTAEQVKAQIEKKWGVTVDPEKTYMVTFAFDNRTDARPFEAVIVQKISLADAARLNKQAVELPPNVPPQRYKGDDASFEIQDNSRHKDVSSTEVAPAPNLAGRTHYYQAIYTDPTDNAGERYDSSNKVEIPVDDFREMVWNHGYQGPYKKYLQFYWNQNGTREAYSAHAKTEFMSAAYKQHFDKSLTDDDRKTAATLLGIPADKAYEDIDIEDLQKPYEKPNQLETKFLTFNGYKSNDIFYTTNKSTNRTLLHIPGNSPPLHGFDSPESMNKWLAAQLMEPAKAEAFKDHFSLDDRASSQWSKGIDARLNLLRQTLDEPGSLDAAGKRGYWKEGGTFDGEVIHTNPFDEAQQRIEQASYSNADHQFVLNADITKNQVVKSLHWLSMGAFALTPVGVALPPVGILTSLFAVGAGAGELAIGIDDKLNHRPGATDRISNGTFNSIKPLLSKPITMAAAPVMPLTVMNKLFLKG